MERASGVVSACDTDGTPVAWLPKEHGMSVRDEPTESYRRKTKIGLAFSLFKHVRSERRGPLSGKGVPSPVSMHESSCSHMQPNASKTFGGAGALAKHMPFCERFSSCFPLQAWAETPTHPPFASVPSSGPRHKV